jgi:hypothetical protein
VTLSVSVSVFVSLSLSLSASLSLSHRQSHESPFLLGPGGSEARARRRAETSQIFNVGICLRSKAMPTSNTAAA